MVGDVAQVEAPLRTLVDLEVGVTPTPGLSRSTVDRDAAPRRPRRARAGLGVGPRPRRRARHGDGARGRPARAAAGPERRGAEGDRLYLGTDDDGPVFAVAAAARRLGARTLGLREVGVLLDDRDAGLLVHAVGLTNWHAAHPAVRALRRADRGRAGRVGAPLPRGRQRPLPAHRPAP
jgi:NAD+ diphosphatase